jgi:hypothetical protein
MGRQDAWRAIFAEEAGIPPPLQECESLLGEAWKR